MEIRRGEFDYDELIRMAEDKIEEIKDLYKSADLPDRPDREQANAT